MSRPPRNTGLPGVRPDLYDLAGSPSDPRVLYVALQKYEAAFSRWDSFLYRTTDSAASWKEVTQNGLPEGLLFQIEVHPSNPNILYAASSRGGLYRLEL